MALNLIEVVAVAVSVVSVWLATRRSLWHYPFALTSVALYARIFFDVKLYADAALQFVFAGVLIYGLLSWWRGRDASGEVIVKRQGLWQIAPGLLAGAAAATAIGYVTSTYTDAALPWLDATLVGYSLVGSFWTARRNIESWLLWIVIDVVYAGVYAYKGLALTAGLYLAFAALAISGFVKWQQALTLQKSRGHAPYGQPLQNPEPLNLETP